jgi:hypothetical protein
LKWQSDRKGRAAYPANFRGKVPVNEEEGYLPMPRYMQKQAEEWSFSKRMSLSLKECPFCGEPITI